MKLELIYNQEVLGKEFNIYGDKENPLFLAKDVAEWVDYSKDSKGNYNVSVMLSKVDEDEKVKIFTNLNNSKVGSNTWFLTEDGLYEVLMQSRKPIAKQFKKEVKKILKQIRLTKGYIAENNEEEFINNYFPSFSEELKLQMIQEATKQNRQYREKIAEQTKTIKMKAIDKPYTIDKVRGLFGMSRKDFEDELYNRGWLKWTEDKQIQILESKYLMKSNKGKKGRPGIYLTEEGLEQITKGRIMK